MLHQVAENELALAPGIARIHQPGHILALDEPEQQVQPLLASVDGRQVEVRRNDRQPGERPLALLDVVLLGEHQLEQVAHRRRQHVVVAFEVIALAHEAAERARDVGRDRRFLGDDEFLAHAKGRR
jgi:hypothetical protein